MTDKPKCIGIIPARYASTRFPGKPLAEISGKPMFWHVFHRASLCPDMDYVAVATDDTRIEAAAKKLDVPVIMTRDDHPSGSDRVLEAASTLDISDDAVVINIQGDEPALAPDMLTQLLGPFSDPGTEVATLARKIDDSAAQNPDQVKVVISATGQGIYFSRSLIPYPRDDQSAIFYGHSGLYAFRLNALKQFVKLPPGRLEIIEKLEQLRLLENNIPIRVVITEYESFGVDRPEDIKKVTKLLDTSA